MELTCAFILFTVGLVTASPYGYGTKGGASAKADASAVAGAIGGVGDLPISPPSSTGYSGSYSKSSASSFASSSASGSSSSFSYTGSGSGVIPGGAGCGSAACQPENKEYSTTGVQSLGNNADAGSVGLGKGSGNGYTSNDVSGGHIANNDDGHTGSPSKTSDCGSGNCQGLHVSGSPSASNAYSQANAAASIGGYGAGSSNSKGLNSGCNGAECISTKPTGTSDKCISGECGYNGYKDADSGANTKCTSGNCATVPQTGYQAPYPSYGNKCVSGKCGPNSQIPVNEKESDDISVPVSSYGSQLHFPDDNKKSPHSTGCAYGNCGSIKPSYPHSSPVAPDGLKCSNPSCSTENDVQSSLISPGNVAPSGYNKPATYLTTPKEVIGCTTPNCQSALPNSRPSSYSGYGSPSYSSNPTPDGKYVNCVGDACAYGQSKAPFTTSNNYQTTNYPNQLSIPTGQKCTSPNCAVSFPSNGPTNCVSGNCGISPVPQGSYGYSGTTSFTTQYSNGGGSKTPENPGLGCAPGTPNCGPGSSSPGYSGLPSGIAPPVYYTQPALGISTDSLPVRPSSPDYSSYNKPLSVAPVTTPGQSTFGSTAGPQNYPSSQPGQYSASGSGQASTAYKPSYTGAGSYHSGPSYTPQAPSSVYTSVPASGAFTPGLLPAYNVPVANPPTSSGSGHYPSLAGGVKPNKDDAPVYQGGFGGPSGILKPNEFEVSLPTNGVPTSPPNIGHAKPACVSGNCGQSTTVPFSPSYAHSGSNAGAQSTAGAVAKADAVAYTGGFGGPPGILKPYDGGKIDLPAGYKQFAKNSLDQGPAASVAPTSLNGGIGSPGYGSAQTTSTAQANAVAGATGAHDNSGHKTGGCGGGCDGSSGTSYNGGSNYGSSGSYGQAKTGSYGSGGLSSATASAKSISSAGGYGGSYAGSSASAHASSGAAIKGSYGRR